MANGGKYSNLLSKDFWGHELEFAPRDPPTPQELEFYAGEFARIRQSFGTTLDEILGKGTTLGWYEVWRALGIFTGWKFCHDHPIGNAEKMIEACFWIIAEVHNGGFDQFFFNSAGDLWPFVMQVLIEGGDPVGMDIFEGVLSIFPNGLPSVNRSKRWEQMDEIRAKDEKGMEAHMDKYTTEYYRHVFPDDRTLVPVILARKSEINLIWPT